MVTSLERLTDREKYELACKIGTIKGFYLHYFALLPIVKNQTKAFNIVNDLHYQIFKEYKYSDYNSYRRALNYHLNNK